MKKSVVIGVILVVLYLAGFVWMSCAWNLKAALAGWLMSMLFAGLLAVSWDDEPELILEPLTLEEAENLDTCWLETRSGFYVEPCAVGVASAFAEGRRPVYSIGIGVENAPQFYDAEYGVSWRCWADKPTEEDSKAASWKEDVEA